MLAFPIAQAYKRNERLSSFEHHHTLFIESHAKSLKIKSEGPAENSRTERCSCKKQGHSCAADSKTSISSTRTEVLAIVNKGDQRF